MTLLIAPPLRRAVRATVLVARAAVPRGELARDEVVRTALAREEPPRGEALPSPLDAAVADGREETLIARLRGAGEAFKLARLRAEVAGLADAFLAALLGERL